MKKLTVMLIFAILLCSCGGGDTAEMETNSAETSETVLTSADTHETSETGSDTEKTEITEDTELSVTSETVLSEADVSEASETTALTEGTEFSYNFGEAELLSESEVIELAKQIESGAAQSDFIEDYTEIDPMGVPFNGSYDVITVPIDADFNAYCSDENNYPMSKEEEYENGVLEKIGENDIYAQWRNAYTEIRRMTQNDVPTVLHLDREYRRLFMKNFANKGREGTVYTGKMNADDIKRNFDVRTRRGGVGMKISRQVIETEDSFIYEFYTVRIIGGDWGLNDVACLEGTAIEISKNDGSFNSEGKKFFEAEYEIPDTAVDIDRVD